MTEMSLLPAVIDEVTEIKRPWWKMSPKIETVLSSVYEYETNNTVTFKIIPHTIVANDNERLWKAVHKMYEMYESTGSRMERKKLKFRLREKDYFWFDVVIKIEKGKRSIAFYVTTSEFQADKLKKRIETNMHVTITQVDPSETHIPEENTVVQDVRYLRHDIFSLNTKKSETRQTPITSLLGTIDELEHEGDITRLSICNEVESRQKWLKSSHFANEQLKKDKIPQRMRVGVKSILPYAKSGIAGVINEVHAIIMDTFEAVSKAFFKFDEEFEKEKLIDKVNGVQDELKGGDVSESSRAKVGQPVFKSRIRVASHSPDQLARETACESVALALSELSDNNELIGMPIKNKNRKKEIIKEMNEYKLSKKTLLDVDCNLMSVDEMSKLALQMPNRELQRKYASEIKSKKIVEVGVPKAFTGKGILLGHSEEKGQKIPIHMPFDNPDELYRAYTFIGGQGAGKDTAIKNWVIDSCLEYGVSSVIVEVIDEEGDRGMADGIRDSLSAEYIIDLDLGNGEWIIPMDLTEVITKLGRLGDSRFADEMIDLIDLGNHTRSRKYLRDAAKASSGSLYNIKRIIEDEAFRLKTIVNLKEKGDIRLARSLASWGDNEELGSKADPILDRLDMFFGNDIMFDIFSQNPMKEVDFTKWMSEGKVIIIRIPNRELGELATKTLVHWVILKTFMTRMLMSAKEKENGCFFVFNEPEQYATEGLTKLMGRIGTEGRKERMGSLWAFHHWNKLSVELQQNLQGGGVQQFLFTNDHLKTFEASKHRFEDTIEIEQAVRLPEHHAIVSVRAKGELQPAFICHMKPPSPTKYDNSFITKRHAQLYGRHWKELQMTI